jgi:class 3 adenylate cyclase
MDGLSVSGLADLAGTTAAEVERLVELGILAARDQRVAESGPPDGVRFVELGELELKGFARPVRLLEVRRT